MVRWQFQTEQNGDNQTQCLWVITSQREHFIKCRNFTKTATMETTIRINTDLLTVDIMEGIKKMFPHKTVDIIIQPSDDTEFILSNPAYARELENRIAGYESNKETVVIKPGDLL